VVLLFRDNLDPDLAPFKAAAPLGIGKFVSFVRGFNFAVPAHPLGEGNVALVVVRNGSVSTHWVRGKDAHYRVSSGVASVCVGGGGGRAGNYKPCSDVSSSSRRRRRMQEEEQNERCSGSALATAAQSLTKQLQEQETAAAVVEDQ
jgi:hypothetical protein